MAAMLIPILIILVVAVAAVAAVVVLTRTQTRRIEEAERPEVPTLRYRVPEGQDPVAVVTALRAEGYEPIGEGEYVVIPTRHDPDRDRAHVRSVIAGTTTSLEGGPTPGQVRFVDER